MTQVIITDDMVEDAIVAHLKMWLPTYMAEVEDSVGIERGFYKRPPEGSYAVQARFNKWPEEQLPYIAVVSPGIDDDPLKDGRGSVRAQFPIGVACVVSSIDEVATRRYAYRLGAAIRTALVQKPSLGGALDGKIRGLDWAGSRNQELPDDEPERSLWMNRQLFIVEVDGVLTKRGGPSAPLPPPGYEPGPDDPVVEHTTQQLEPINA